MLVCIIICSKQLKILIILNIKTYIDYVPADHRDNIRNYAYAFLYYTKKEFEKSLEFISVFKNNEFHIFKIDIKHLMLKNYYELNSFEQALITVDAYKHFLDSNQKIPEHSKNYYRNFL